MGLSFNVFFRNGINFQLIRTSGSKMPFVFVEELWGSVCLSCKNQETVCHRGFCIIRSYYSLKWVPDWLFPWQILIVMHLAIHLTRKRKWFISLERYKVFHYLIISANSYSPHPLVSLIMVLPHQLSPVCFSRRLRELIRTLELGCYSGSQEHESQIPSRVSFMLNQHTHYLQ